MTINSFKFMSKTLAESLKSGLMSIHKREPIPWTPLKKKVHECRVALVSSGGLNHRNDTPFDMNGRNESRSGVIPPSGDSPRGIKQDEIEQPTCTMKCPYPPGLQLHAPRRHPRGVAPNGEIGGITDNHLTFMGYQPKPGVFIRETAPE